LPKSANPLIGIVPIGNVNEDVLRVIGDTIQGVLRLPVDIFEYVPMPQDALMYDRDQFNAMVLLKFLHEQYNGRCLKVLGVTNKDLGNPILTYVFGEGYMGGSAAVISYFRLYKGTINIPVSREHFLERLAKVALHEIGHTFHLPHCRRERCVMRVSNGLADLDQKLTYLCDYCELFLFESVAKELKENLAE
jgi:archaemetzincin